MFELPSTAEAGPDAAESVGGGGVAGDVLDVGDSSVHVVEPGESLWSIADEELGDPQRWPEVYEANEGRTFADGRTPSDPDVIQPGWELDVPVEDPVDAADGVDADGVDATDVEPLIDVVETAPPTPPAPASPPTGAAAVPGLADSLDPAGAANADTSVGDRADSAARRETSGIRRAPTWRPAATRRRPRRPRPRPRTGIGRRRPTMPMPMHMQPHCSDSAVQRCCRPGS